MRLNSVVARMSWPVLLAALAISSLAQAGGHGTINLSGTVAGASGKNAIYVALWSDADFLKRPVQQTKIAPGASPTFAFQVPAGRWALSAFEDENGNGRLDMGMFGPKEPSGFWRAFHAWRKPRFDDVAFQVDRDTKDIVIQVHR